MAVSCSTWLARDKNHQIHHIYLVNIGLLVFVFPLTPEMMLMLVALMLIGLDFLMLVVFEMNHFEMTVMNSDQYI